MKFYEYDAQGWLVGWYEAETPRPNSTPILPLFPASQSRWVNGAWTLDPSREQQRDADAATLRTRRQEALALCDAYNPATATAVQVRQTLGAALQLLRRLMSES